MNPEKTYKILIAEDSLYNQENMADEIEVALQVPALKPQIEKIVNDYFEYYQKNIKEKVESDPAYSTIMGKKHFDWKEDLNKYDEKTQKLMLLLRANLGTDDFRNKLRETVKEGNYRIYKGEPEFEDRHIEYNIGHILESYQEESSVNAAEVHKIRKEYYQRLLTEEIQERVGKNVTVDLQTNVADALKAMSENKYDLVISDLGLPFSLGQNEKLESEYTTTLETLTSTDSANHTRNELSNTAYEPPSKMWRATGVLVLKKAKELGLKTALFTSTEHYIEGAGFAAIAGEMSVQEYKQILSVAEKENEITPHSDGPNYYSGVSDMLVRTRKSFWNVNDKYIGDKYLRKIADTYEAIIRQLD